MSSLDRKVRACCDRCGKPLTLWGSSECFVSRVGEAFTWGNAPMRCACGGTYRGR